MCVLTIKRKLRLSVQQLPQSGSCSKPLHQLRVEWTHTYRSNANTPSHKPLHAPSQRWKQYRRGKIHIIEKCTCILCVFALCYLQYWCRPRRCTWGTMKALPHSCAGWPSEGLLCTAPTGSWCYRWDHSETHTHRHTFAGYSFHIYFICFTVSWG